jgi:hypothetical protein
MTNYFVGLMSKHTDERLGGHERFADINSFVLLSFQVSAYQATEHRS